MKTKGTHLTLSDRIIIEKGIVDGKTKTEIAAEIGKDNSTVGKEISLHRKPVSDMRYTYPVTCANYKSCKIHSCSYPNKNLCTSYELFTCKRRDRSPGACNGCEEFHKCHQRKFKYIAKDAQNEYEEDLVDSRIGENLTYDEAKKIADILGPLLKQGQSPYQILINHPELNISEKTLYNYLEQGTLYEFGITNMDLRIQLKRRISKKASDNYKKRKDKRYLIGRKYEDFQRYIEEHPASTIMEMDTVYNDISAGPFIQTFSIRNTGFLIAFYHSEKTAENMLRGINALEELLGSELFEKYVEVLLTDRGSEFTAAQETEFRNDGSRRTHLFYCDPMCSGQKGSLENKHIRLRYILPKETNLAELGLTSQAALNKVISNINSIPVSSLNGKTPYEFVEFMYPDIHQKLVKFGIHRVEPDSVILNPTALTK